MFHVNRRTNFHIDFPANRLSTLVTTERSAAFLPFGPTAAECTSSRRGLLVRLVAVPRVAHTLPFIYASSLQRAEIAHRS